MNITRTNVTCALTFVLAVGLAGCGSSGSKSTGSSSPSPSSLSSNSSTSSSTKASGSSSPSAPSSTQGGGEAGKSPTQVFADAKSALSKATSVRISGSIADHGKQQKLDLRFQGDNTSGSETINGSVVNLVKIGSVAYIKAPAAFWTKAVGAKANGAKAATALAGKWIKDPGQSDLLSSLTLRDFASHLNSTDSAIQPDVKHTTFQGKKALVLTQKDGSTLTVADATPPVPLRITDTSAASKGQLDFADYGAAQSITAPKSAVMPAQALKGQQTTA